MSEPFWRLLAALAVAFTATLGLAWCIGGCGASLPIQAEAQYGAELQACVVKAKLTDGGRAASRECEAEVDARWLVHDGGTR